MAGTRTMDRRVRSTTRRERVAVPGAGSARRAPRGIRRIMLASTGSPIHPSVIDRTVELVSELGAGRPTQVVVISVARIWGTSLGLPNPGLYPNKLEWAEVRAITEAAAEELRRRGVEATTKAVASRHAGKAVARWAQFMRCRAIVVGAPEMGTWDRWVHGDEPRNVERRANVPVYAVPLPPEPRKRSGFGVPRSV
jgi:nucleotide-binding universal stress UspA family protein